MPYTNDAQTMADVVSPVDAAMQAGQQNGAANIQQAIANQVAQGQAPAEIQKPFLQNLFTQAQTQTQQGLAQQQQAAGQEAQALLPTNIGVGQAAGQTKITGAHVEQLQQLGQIVGGLAGQMQNVPPAARPAMMNQILDSMGVSDPSMRSMVNSGDPDQLNQVSQGLFQASNAARQSMLQENMRGQFAENVANIGANARVTGAEASANARVQAAQLMAAIRAQQQNFEQAAVAAAKAGNPDLANKLSALAIQAKQANAGISSQLMFQQPLSIPQFGPEGGGNTPTNPGQPQALSGDAMINAAKQLWPNDDPTKYDYRMGPNGDLQRRPKQ